MTRIKFRYYEAPMILKGIKDEVERKLTVCLVSLGDNVSMTGLAIHNPKDHYNKLLGRKIALTRAVERLPKEKRTEIWNEYLTTHRV